MGWLALGMKLFPFIVEAVNWVEKFIKAPRGQYKQDAAVYMVKATLGLVEAGAGKDLLDDEDVEKATREVIDAIVALNNLVAKKQT